jgi:hypothetical protein
MLCLTLASIPDFGTVDHALGALPRGAAARNKRPGIDRRNPGSVKDPRPKAAAFHDPI